MTKTDTSRSEKSRPDRAELRTLFGPPPLLDGEDTEFTTSFSKKLRPP